jgi:Domain of unknown function (DUF6457)
MTDSRSDLIEAVAAEFGVEPLEADDVDAVLALAGAAAHGTGDRTTAPLCCFLAGLAAGAGARTRTLERMCDFVATTAPAQVEGTT